MKSYLTKFKSFLWKIVQMGTLQKLQNSIQTLVIFFYDRDSFCLLRDHSQVEGSNSPLQKREGTGASFLYWLDWKSKH